MNLESVGGPGQVSGVDSVARSVGPALDLTSRMRSVDAASNSTSISLGDLGKYVAAVQNQQSAPSERVDLLKAAVLQGSYGSMLERLAEKLAGLAHA